MSPSGGQFVTTDRLRPPAINTYDMRGDYVRAINYLNGVIELTTERPRRPTATTPGPIGATVDAHVYAGWTYDYYFKRFGRRGLDNQRPPARQPRPPGAALRTSCRSSRLVPDFYLNAVYFGDGIMVYGDGLPAGFTAGGQTSTSSPARSTSWRTSSPTASPTTRRT